MIEANGAASLAVTNWVRDACQHADELPADFRAPSEFRAPFTLSGLSRVTEPSLSHINSSVKPPSEMRTFGHQRPSRFGLSSRQTVHKRGNSHGDKTDGKVSTFTSN